jgi:hypothetical protein
MVNQIKSNSTTQFKAGASGEFAMRDLLEESKDTPEDHATQKESKSKSSEKNLWSKSKSSEPVRVGESKSSAKQISSLINQSLSRQSTHLRN